MDTMKVAHRAPVLPTLFLTLLVVMGPFARAPRQQIPAQAAVCCIQGHPQSYTLSCEARAAVDWASFFGVIITETDFMNALPQSDDPESGFVGHWNAPWGDIPPNAYGVHPPPVAKTLRDFGVNAIALENLTWDDLRREIAADRPVIVWVIAQMWTGQAVPYTSQSGATTRVARFEHTMILTGYTPSSVQVVDALTGQTKFFARDAFLLSWAVLGNRAVLAGIPHTPAKTHQPTPQPSPTVSEPPPGAAHTVTAGESLLSISRAHGILWGDLAQANDLFFPYFLYPGDVLQLPSSAHTPKMDQP